MKGNLGIAVILFAIFLSLNSVGMEIITFPIAIVGLIIAIGENAVKAEKRKNP